MIVIHNRNNSNTTTWTCIISKIYSRTHQNNKQGYCVKKDKWSIWLQYHHKQSPLAIWQNHMKILSIKIKKPTWDKEPRRKDWSRFCKHEPLRIMVSAIFYMTFRQEKFNERKMRNNYWKREIVEKFCRNRGAEN